jgi:hypothetical protein
MADEVTPSDPEPEATSAPVGSAAAEAPAVVTDGEVVRRDEDVVDELPHDLHAAGYVGPYLFPNNKRRRVPGVIYLVLAALVLTVWATVDSSYVNGGYVLGGLLLAVVGAYHLLTGWDLVVDEQDALVAAGREVGFPVGHASAQMGWRGLRSRPLWRILLYSDEDPPAKRGLVLVDGVDGTVVEHFVEDNPEDWSQLR